MTGSPSVEVADLLLLHRQMRTIRAFEEQVTRLAQVGEIYGAAHSYAGMEAIAVGACAALEPTDWITSTHRGHGHCIAKGSDLELMFAEMLSRVGGYCGAKGGSLHLTDLSRGMLGADGIVGGSIGLAVGAAFAERLRGSDSVALSFFGDGAVNQGSFHEAVNLAAVQELGVVFLCENNRWSLSTETRDMLAVDSIVHRSTAYGIPGVVVDGNEVGEVRQAVVEAVTAARSGGGPTLIEARTYRLMGHSTFSASEHRDPAELDAAWAAEPLAVSRRRLVAAAVEPAVLDAVDAEVVHSVAAAAQRALERPHVDVATALDDVYAPAPWNQLDRVP